MGFPWVPAQLHTHTPSPVQSFHLRFRQRLSPHVVETCLRCSLPQSGPPACVKCTRMNGIPFILTLKPPPSPSAPVGTKTCWLHSLLMSLIASFGLPWPLPTWRASLLSPQELAAGLVFLSVSCLLHSILHLELEELSSNFQSAHHSPAWNCFIGFLLDSNSLSWPTAWRWPL